MPQGDKNDSEPGIIAETPVYEHEGFDGSHDGINGTDDSAAYITVNEPGSLKYDHQWPLLQTWFNFNPSMDK